MFAYCKPAVNRQPGFRRGTRRAERRQTEAQAQKMAKAPKAQKRVHTQTHISKQTHQTVKSNCQPNFIKTCAAQGAQKAMQN